MTYTTSGDAGRAELGTFTSVLSLSRVNVRFEPVKYSLKRDVAIALYLTRRCLVSPNWCTGAATLDGACIPGIESPAPKTTRYHPAGCRLPPCVSPRHQRKLRRRPRWKTRSSRRGWMPAVSAAGCDESSMNSRQEASMSTYAAGTVDMQPTEQRGAYRFQFTRGRQRRECVGQRPVLPN